MNRHSVSRRIFLLLFGGILTVIFFSLLIISGLFSTVLLSSIDKPLHLAARKVQSRWELFDTGLTPYSSPEFYSRWKELEQIRSDFGLTYLYLMKTNSFGQLVFVCDTGDDPRIRAISGKNGLEFDLESWVKPSMAPAVVTQDGIDNVGAAYVRPPDAAWHAWKSARPSGAGLFYTDEYGTFRSVFYPVVAQGQTIFLIGADTSLSEYSSGIYHLAGGSVVFLAVVTLLVVLIRRLLNRKVIRPLMELNEKVRLAAGGHLDQPISIESDDEIGELADGFRRLEKNLKRSFERIENYNEDLLNQLYTDRLTGIPNRRKLMKDLPMTADPVIILINIDGFQEINDFYGNGVGDLLLKEMADRLKSLALGAQYTFYKMYADEYAIVLDEEQDTMRLQILGIYFSEGIVEKPFIYEETEIYITASLGIGKSGDPLVMPEKPAWEKALANADMALRKARALRRKYVIYDNSADLAHEYETNLSWANRLRSAIKENRIVPYFQPIFNNHSGKVEKYECLVRLIDSDGTAIDPQIFLKVARKARLYRYITRIMIDKSIAFFRDTGLEFSINLALDDILDEKTVGYIQSRLREEPQMAEKLTFEILETEDIEKYQEVRAFVREMKNCGARVAIDDFGTGYSNFSHIIHLHVDYIKIDASLIKNVPTDRNAQVIVKTIAAFARELEIQTVAEYVHSKEVFEKLIELGIDYSQGYYFGKPGEKI